MVFQCRPETFTKLIAGGFATWPGGTESNEWATNYAGHFLIEAGLVHRLDSLNAFVGCRDPEHPHAGQFLICRRCRTVVELDDPEIDAVVAKKAGRLGFTAVHQMLEVQGLCGNCGEAG